MYPEIENVLNRYGYQKITLNITGISLSVKQQGELGLVVVTIDETTGHEISRDQFVHISEQFRAFLRERNCYHSIFLYLLISEDDFSAKRLFESYENYWRIIPTRRQLLVYENGGTEFNELRAPLEALFPGRMPEWDRRDASFSQGRDGYGESREPSYRGNQRNYGRGRVFPLGNGKTPYVNLAVVICNVLIFLVTDFLLFQEDTVVSWGALNWYQVFGEGEWYRILTSMFLHDGIQHIFNNMLVLIYIGTLVEQQMGGARYGILYLGSGVLAGFTSMVYNMNLNENVYSLGASGAIFGIMGALLFLVLFRRKYSGGYNVRQIIIMVLFSLYGGFASQGVDNAAHLGGFLSGFLLSAVLSIGIGTVD